MTVREFMNAVKVEGDIIRVQVRDLGNTDCVMDNLYWYGDFCGKYDSADVELDDEQFCDVMNAEIEYIYPDGSEMMTIEVYA